MSVPTIITPSPKAGTGGCVGRGELVGLGLGVEVRVRVLVPRAANVIEGAATRVGVEEGAIGSVLGGVPVGTAVLFETISIDSEVFVARSVLEVDRETT